MKDLKACRKLGPGEMAWAGGGVAYRLAVRKEAFYFDYKWRGGGQWNAYHRFFDELAGNDKGRLPPLLGMIAYVSSPLRAEKLTVERAKLA